VIAGWDSATFDVIDPLLADGCLPALGRLVDAGFRAPLRSTWPPMTDSAWTSAFTGTNPGRHGIFGSWYRAPGAYSCRYFSARDRRAPSLWELADGIRFLVYNVPMTFPPGAIDGAMVSGYGAPPGAPFCRPAELQDELTARWPVGDLMDRAPHGSLERFLDDLLRGLRSQTEAIVWLGERTAADCVVIVWPQIDRAQHFFWRFRASDHPLRDAVERVYVAMDRATGALAEAWADADLVVVSDHGAGPLHGDLNLGSWLVDNGHARYGATRRSGLLELAWRMPAAVRRAGRRVAPRLARRAFGATLAGQLGPFDWHATEAFLGFHGDLWLNLEGREPRGNVPVRSAPALLDELSGELLALRDEISGDPVLAAVYGRAEIYSGPSAGLAPDLILDSWSAGYRVSPHRAPAERVVGPPSPLAGVREAWSSDHRPVGVFVAHGPRIESGRADELSLLDVCPTALALLESEVPEGLDGRVADEALDGRFLERHPVRNGPARARTTSGREYSEEEAEAVAAHLRDLGYIE
jgi:predicted AlkP superfamily phosphohydrolase/phosphomutase